MALRYAFRNVFYKGDINKRRLYQILQDIDNESTAGGTTHISQLVSRIGALETAVGKASGQGAGGIAKDVSDMKTDIGVATSGSETGIHKSIADINTAIGDESTEGSILYRLKELENE